MCTTTCRRWNGHGLGGKIRHAAHKNSTCVLGVTKFDKMSVLKNPGGYPPVRHLLIKNDIFGHVNLINFGHTMQGAVESGGQSLTSSFSTTVGRVRRERTVTF